MNLQSTDFELFDVPERFAQDADALQARWKALQRQVHPDRFAAQGAAAQRMAAQWSARVNEAYRRLKNPLQRAAYLCEINGQGIDAERNTAMPAAFLERQMQLREALENAEHPDALQAIETEFTSMSQQAFSSLARQIDEQQDWLAAAQTVRALMFLDKFGTELARRRATDARH
ncbi:MAG: Fe-S protein assembly co-chaperone HscB [Burkholderiaceae bacterium]|nr:Fe-S protein assembly co-chaperone HscB [Burkholderiaceae bacterium]